MCLRRPEVFERQYGGFVRLLMVLKIAGLGLGASLPRGVSGPGAVRRPLKWMGRLPEIGRVEYSRR